MAEADKSVIAFLAWTSEGQQWLLQKSKSLQMRMAALFDIEGASLRRTVSQSLAKFALLIPAVANITESNYKQLLREWNHSESLEIDEARHILAKSFLTFYYWCMESATVRELPEKLKRLSLPTSGPRDVLVKRLIIGSLPFPISTSDKTWFNNPLSATEVEEDSEYSNTSFYRSQPSSAVSGKIDFSALLGKAFPNSSPAVSSTQSSADSNPNPAQQTARISGVSSRSKSSSQSSLQVTQQQLLETLDAPHKPGMIPRPKSALRSMMAVKSTHAVSSSSAAPTGTTTTTSASLEAIQSFPISSSQPPPPPTLIFTSSPQTGGNPPLSPSRVVPPASPQRQPPASPSRPQKVLPMSPQRDNSNVKRGVGSLIPNEPSSRTLSPLRKLFRTVVAGSSLETAEPSAFSARTPDPPSLRKRPFSVNDSVSPSVISSSQGSLTDSPVSAFKTRALSQTSVDGQRDVPSRLDAILAAQQQQQQQQQPSTSSLASSQTALNSLKDVQRLERKRSLSESPRLQVESGRLTPLRRGAQTPVKRSKRPARGRRSPHSMWRDAQGGTLLMASALSVRAASISSLESTTLPDFVLDGKSMQKSDSILKLIPEERLTKYRKLYQIEETKPERVRQRLQPFCSQISTMEQMTDDVRMKIFAQTASEEDD